MIGEPIKWMEIVERGGALVLLAAVLLGGGWVAWQAIQIIRKMQTSYFDALAKQQAAFLLALSSQREAAIEKLDAIRAEDISDRRLMREALDRNTHALSVLTSSLVGRA